MPSAFDLSLMALCGVIAAAGSTLLTQAYRVAEANVVAPFEYTGLVWSVAFGWIFWRDWPDPVAWAGVAIIVAAGLYVLYSERRVQPEKG
jgi:drug/metabolite transporter (DMT)-like permease